MSAAPHLHVVPDPALPPQNLEAEENVLGAMLLNNEHAVATVAEILRSADFYRPSHGVIFKAAVDLFTEGTPVDAITLTDHLEGSGKLSDAGGALRVHELSKLIPAAGNAGHYARIVKDMATLRSGIAAGEEISRSFRDRVAATPELVDRAQHLVYSISEGDTSHDPVPIGAAMKASYKTLVEFAESGRELIGVSTGFRALDRMTAGLQPGNLVIIAARPSMGKSALAHKIAANLAVKDNVPVLLFSLEMSEAEVSQRLWAMRAGVEGNRVRAASLTPDEWGRVQEVVAKLENAPLYIDDSPLVRVTELRSKARRLKTRVPNLGLVVVDYLQLMTSGQNLDNRVQEVSQISRALKILARDLHLPVIALSQLSRAVEQRPDKRPILSDLRESGSIEQDADIVAFVYRHHYYDKSASEREAEIIVAKQRNGPTNTVLVQFERDFARFSELGS